MQRIETNIIRLVALILIIGTASCSEANDPSSSDIMIYGGDEVPANEWMHVAAVTSERSNGTHEIICSATLISDRHLLTAGHCLDSFIQARDRESALARLRVYFGPGEEGGILPADSAVLNLTTAFVHPALRLHPGGNADIAVLTLNAPVRSIRPIPIIASYDKFLQQVEEGSVVKLIGFGRRDDHGLGRKFLADSTARQISAWESFAGKDGRDSCTGDSGGPGYIANSSGRWVQYAVVSRGSSFQCGNGGIMTHIAPHACWISEVTGLKFAGTSTQCAQAPSYTQKQLAAIDFAHVCRSGKGTNRFQRETINRLKFRFKTNDCKALATELSASTINLDNLLLRDLSPIAPFTNVEQLSLVNNLARTPEVLLQYPALKSLAIAGNNFANPAQELAALTQRNVRITGLTAQIDTYANTAFLALCNDASAADDVKQTIKGIKARTMTDDCANANSRLLMMTTLSLSDRGLTNLAPLAGLPHLKSLDLSNNPISDLSPLAGLDHLKSLNVSGTNVSDFSPLALLIDAGLVIKQ